MLSAWQTVERSRTFQEVNMIASLASGTSIRYPHTTALAACRAPAAIRLPNTAIAYPKQSIRAHTFSRTGTSSMRCLAACHSDEASVLPAQHRGPVVVAGVHSQPPVALAPRGLEVELVLRTALLALACCQTHTPLITHIRHPVHATLKRRDEGGLSSHYSPCLAFPNAAAS